MRLVGRLWHEIENGPEGTIDNHAPEAEDEEVGGHRKELSRLPDSAQVGERDDHDRREAEQDAPGIQRGNRGRDGRDTGRHAHRHREHVIGHQGGPGHQARQRTEVVLGHEVGAPALRIGSDGLAVRAHHDGDQRADGDRNRKRVAESDRARQDEHEQDLLRGVGHRGQGVGGEDSQGGALVQALVTGLGGRKGGPDEDPLQP